MSSFQQIPPGQAIRTPPLASAPERATEEIAGWEESVKALDSAALQHSIIDFVHTPRGRAMLEAIFGNSPYLSFCLQREIPFFQTMITQEAHSCFSSLLEKLETECAQEDDTDRLMRALRIGKRQASLLIAWADIGGEWSLEEVTTSLSHFASLSLSLTLRHLLRRYIKTGDLILKSSDTLEEECGIIILGMGKLGALELNYSSDIDLIIFFDEDKLTYTGRRSLQECVIRITKDIVRIIEERTADGYVFRVDLRLRPDPGSTPAAIALDAAEIYYEAFGQNWERAAMIKVRPVAGDMHAGKEFVKFLRPFIWRKNLDFAAIKDIHSIKRQINAFRGGNTIAVAGHNIKLGRGGIREIEFFAQTQQLIWGGRQPDVRSSQTCEALLALTAAEHIAPEVSEQMIEAYRFLRHVEHRLQMIDDAQIQTLPHDPEKLHSLALFCGFDTVDDFSAYLTKHLETVERHYSHLFEDAPGLGDEKGNLVFTGGENDPETLKTISAMGFANPGMIASQIRGWHHGRVRATRSARARELLTELTPALLSSLGKTANPDAAFLSFDRFLSRLPAGVPLFSLFRSNPALLDLVAEIMGDAPRLSRHLSHKPLLLDAVLSPHFFDPLPAAPVLGGELDALLRDSTDYEETLDTLRRWVNDHKFQIGVQTLRTLLSAEQSAEALSTLADIVLSRLHPVVEAEMIRIHGSLPGVGMAVVAMGKLGSREMTATSDLDLIVIYDLPDSVENSTGPRPIPPSVYFSRLTQRLVTAITFQTVEGNLYEVDMRLRPSGNAGPIASSLDAFERYHKEMSWTWEHQALTRARVITGPDTLKRRINAIIRQTLSTPRDPRKLAIDVSEMRLRMDNDRAAESIWDVKRLRGGLIDIEFIVQYLQLRHAATHPDILFGTNHAILEKARSFGLLSQDETTILIDGLWLWMTIQSVLRQTIDGNFIEAEAPIGLKDILVRATRSQSFEELKDRMRTTAVHVLCVYTHLIDDPAAGIA